MAALDGIANLANAGACFAAFGRLQAEARTLGPLVGRPIAVCTIRLHPRQAPAITGVYATRGDRRLYHHTL
jgi:hypothetical protein